MTQEDQMTDDEGGPIGVGAPERQRETMDDLDVLLAALPPEIVGRDPRPARPRRR